MNRRLCVMIPARERIIMTQKCIESIHENTKHFDKIEIYIFDNLSELKENSRFYIFQNLLSEGKISYYSYDTKDTTLNCFSKVTIFKRWIQMMKLDFEFKQRNNILQNTKNYYVTVDNDFIFGPKWDSYFICALDKIKHKEKNIKFVTQYPGGVPSRYIENSSKFEIRNIFLNNSFNVVCANGGGASGFWMMDYEMLCDIEWDIDTMSLTYKKGKGHDINTWGLIKRRFGKDVRYVACIMVPEKDPLLVHLGGRCGSICNALNKHVYDESRDSFSRMEKEFEFMDSGEIFQEFKTTNDRW